MQGCRDDARSGNRAVRHDDDRIPGSEQTATRENVPAHGDIPEGSRRILLKLDRSVGSEIAAHHDRAAYRGDTLAGVDARVGGDTAGAQSASDGCAAHIQRSGENVPRRAEHARRSNGAVENGLRTHVEWSDGRINTDIAGRIQRQVVAAELNVRRIDSARAGGQGHAARIGEIEGCERRIGEINGGALSIQRIPAERPAAMDK